MAGIRAQSVTKTAAAAGADVAASGFLVNEQIVLSAEPAGSGYAWSLSAPSDSAPVVSALDDAEDARPAFTPDVPGLYLVTVTVDGATAYVLRIAVARPSILRTAEAWNLLPLADSQVPTPQVGVSLYFSSDAGALVVKNTSGAVTPL
jgi:hypothetical protein